MSKKFFDTIPREYLTDFIRCSSHSKATNGSVFKAKARVRLSFKLQGKDHSHIIRIVPGLFQCIILGEDFMKNNATTLSFSENDGIAPWEESGLGTLTEDHDPLPVLSAIRLRVGAGSTLKVPCNVPYGTEPGDYTVYIAASEGLLHTSLTVCPAMYTIGQEFNITLRISNNSETAVTIDKGREIAKIRPFSLLSERTSCGRGNDETINFVDEPRPGYKNLRDLPRRNKSQHLRYEHRPAQGEETRKIPNIGAGAGKGREPLRALLLEYSHLFTDEDLELGSTNVTVCKIKLKTDEPVRKKPYDVPFSRAKIMDHHVKKLEDAGIIRKSKSPYRSPCILVPKGPKGSPPDDPNSWWLWIDYRGLNEVTVKESYPLPQIKTLLGLLHGAKYFSKFDLKSGFLQVEMHADSAPLTAFATQYGHYEYVRMPYGLTNAPSVFQRLADSLTDGVREFVLGFVDDFLVFSKTWQEHVEHIRAFFEIIQEANLKCNLSKSDVALLETPYLGHIVSAEGVQPHPDNVKAIKEAPVPHDLKSIRSFLGMCCYYRNFIYGYSTLAAPLEALTRTVDPVTKLPLVFKWNPRAQCSFEAMKEILTSKNVLILPDQNKPFIVTCDASKHAVGAVISQFDEKGVNRPIVFLSHRLRGAQLSWGSTQQEMFAIIYALRKESQMLLSSDVIIRTDHKPLTLIGSSQSTNAMVLRWVVYIQTYGANLIFINGSANVTADYLSRIKHSNESKADTGFYDQQMTEAFEMLTLEPGPALTPTYSDYLACLSESECLEGWEKEERAINFIDSSDTMGRVWDDGEVGTGATPRLKDPLAAELIAKLQKQDPVYGPIIKSLEEGSNHPLYILTSEDGEPKRLFMYSRKTKNQTLPTLALAVPQSMVYATLAAFHDDLGHVSAERVYNMLYERAYWPNFNGDIHKYVLQCKVCAARRANKNKAPLEQPPPPTGPQQKVSIDLYGPLPRCIVTGATYILSAVDHFSGYVNLYPLPNKTTDAVCDTILRQHVPQHGVPLYFLSDNGGEFMSNAFARLTSTLHVRHLHTTAYHPQANSKVESFHRFLGNVLAKITRDLTPNWTQNLHVVTLAYNTSPHSVHQHSPFYLNHMRPCRLPGDLMLGVNRKFLGEGDYVSNALSKLGSTFKLVRQRLIQSQQNSKEYADTKFNAKTREFEVGQKVEFWYPRGNKDDPKHSKKLKNRWIPYYAILRKLSPVNYEILHEPSGSIRKTHVDNLQAALPNQFFQNQHDNTYKPFAAKHNIPMWKTPQEAIDARERLNVRAGEEEDWQNPEGQMGHARGREDLGEDITMEDNSGIEAPEHYSNGVDSGAYTPDAAYGANYSYSPPVELERQRPYRARASKLDFAEELIDNEKLFNYPDPKELARKINREKKREQRTNHVPAYEGTESLQRDTRTSPSDEGHDACEVGTEPNDRGPRRSSRLSANKRLADGGQTGEGGKPHTEQTTALNGNKRKHMTDAATEEESCSNKHLDTKGEMNEKVGEEGMYHRGRLRERSVQGGGQRPRKTERPIQPHVRPNPACKRTRDESVDLPHKTLRGAEVLEEEHEEDMNIKDNVDPAEITSDDEQMLFAGEHEVQSRLTRYSQGTTVTRQELEDIQSDSDILADRDFPPL